MIPTYPLVGFTRIFMSCARVFSDTFCKSLHTFEVVMCTFRTGRLPLGFEVTSITYCMLTWLLTLPGDDYIVAVNKQTKNANVKRRSKKHVLFCVL